jgi:type II secretory pathway pseudopilin PulG
VNRRSRCGFSLVEIAIAAALVGLVMLLVGSLLVGSLNAWRRGQDLREAQAMASVLVDAVARDIRGASQAPNVVIRPLLPLEEGEPLLMVAAPPQTSDRGGSTWILFAHVPQRQEVIRHVVETRDGRSLFTQARVVASGVTRITVEPIVGGVTIDVEVRRGGAIGQARATAAPRNP